MSNYITRFNGSTQKPFSPEIVLIDLRLLRRNESIESFLDSKLHGAKRVIVLEDSLPICAKWTNIRVTRRKDYSPGPDPYYQRKLEVLEKLRHTNGLLEIIHYHKETGVDNEYYAAKRLVELGMPTFMYTESDYLVHLCLYNGLTDFALVSEKRYLQARTITREALTVYSTIREFVLMFMILDQTIAPYITDLETVIPNHLKQRSAMAKLDNVSDVELLANLSYNIVALQDISVLDRMQFVGPPIWGQTEAVRAKADLLPIQIRSEHSRMIEVIQEALDGDERAVSTKMIQMRLEYTMLPAIMMAQKLIAFKRHATGEWIDPTWAPDTRFRRDIGYFFISKSSQYMLDAALNWERFQRSMDNALQISLRVNNIIPSSLYDLHRAAIGMRPLAGNLADRTLYTGKLEPWGAKNADVLNGEVLIDQFIQYTRETEYPTFTKSEKILTILKPMSRKDVVVPVPPQRYAKHPKPSRSYRP